MDSSLRKTPLYDAHVALNARIVDYAGWAMPVLYSGILEEARAVRSQVGIFDISHMGRIRISGAGAEELLQSLTSNDVVALNPSEAQYSLLTNPDGGIIDDIIVYRETATSFLVVINAGNSAKDIAWIREHLTSDAVLDDMTAETAMIAVQGPAAPALVSQLASSPELTGLKRFQYATGSIGDVSATFCRTGYTGEDGFEVIVDARHAIKLWDVLVAAAAAPCGLGARDALRIEAGYPLYGHEIDDMTSPVEAGLMWVVKLEKGDFTGRQPIADLKERGAERKLVGLVCTDRQVPRQGYTVLSGDEPVGVVTSGVFSPTRNRSIAMAYVRRPYSHTGANLSIAVRDKRMNATVVPKKSLLE